jgi:hypothetical protein
MRMSVRTFADALGVAHRTVGRWEASGDRAELLPDSQEYLDTMLERADPPARQRFAQLLGAAAAQDGASHPLAAACDDNAVTTPRPQRPWDPVLATPTVDFAPMLYSAMAPGAGRADRLDDEVDDVDRRRFLQTLAALGTSMAGLETLRHDLLAAVGGDAADLAEWEAIAWEYGSAYTTTPPADLLRQLATDLLVAREQLGRVRSDPQRRGLQRVIAQLAAYTAQSAGNLGDPREAVRWWRAARQAADASDNADVRVWVRGREVIRGLYEHRPLDTMLALADEALAITTQPGMGTGSVLCGRAQALAMLGRANEARQALNDLYDLVDRLPARVTSDVDSMYGWPEYRTRHTESFVWTHIGDIGRAAVAQELALPMYPAGMARERAQVQLHRALGLIRTGDPAAGAADACAALEGLPSGQRIEVVLEVARWAAAAVPARGHRYSEVGQLREMLALPSGPGS